MQAWSVDSRRLASLRVQLWHACAVRGRAAASAPASQHAAPAPLYLIEQGGGEEPGDETLAHVYGFLAGVFDHGNVNNGVDMLSRMPVRGPGVGSLPHAHLL